MENEKAEDDDDRVREDLNWEVLKRNKAQAMDSWGFTFLQEKNRGESESFSNCNTHKKYERVRRQKQVRNLTIKPFSWLFFFLSVIG